MFSPQLVGNFSHVIAFYTFICKQFILNLQNIFARATFSKIANKGTTITADPKKLLISKKPTVSLPIVAWNGGKLKLGKPGFTSPNVNKNYCKKHWKYLCLGTLTYLLKEMVYYHGLRKDMLQLRQELQQGYF